MKKQNINKPGKSGKKSKRGRHIFMFPAIVMTKDSSPEDMVKAINENQEALEKSIKDLENVSIKSIKDAQKQLEDELKTVKGVMSAEQYKELCDTNKRLEKALQDQAKDLLKLEGIGVTPQLKGKALFEDMVHKALKANWKEIKAIGNGGTNVKFSIGNVTEEDETKDASTITSTNFGAGVLQGLRLTEVEDLDRNENFILSLINVINGGPGSDPFSWVEKVVGQGGAAGVAEGAAKPFYDFTYVEGKVTAETIAAIVPVSKQALLRMPRLMSDIQTELMAELREEIQRQVILGTGVLGSEIRSIDYYATDFNAGGLAASVPFANDFDVVRAVRAQIRRSRGKVGKLVILVSPDKAAMMDLQKTETEGLYLMPPFCSADGTIIKGVYVIECDDITDDDVFYAGDFSKYMLNIVQGITFEVGYINDQFQRNQLSVRAEIFASAGVKAQHTNKLIVGNFVTAKAALEEAPIVL